MQDTQSPYLPPESAVQADLTESLPVVPASKGLRFANLIIDYIGYIIFAFIIGILIGLIFGERGTEFIATVPDILLGIPIMLTYYSGFEYLGGRTPGKYITGTKVVNEQGLKPTFWQVLSRSLCRLIPFEAFSFFGSDNRGWHDSLPKTYVVKCR